MYTKEEWKRIPGYQEYEISSKGQVRRGDRVLKVDNHTGKARYHLCEKGIQHTCGRARLLAEAFIPNPQKKSFVMHVDGNPFNDSIDNLRWTTRSHISNHYIKHGFSGFKYTQEQIDYIRREYEKDPQSFCVARLARELDISENEILHILSNRRRTQNTRTNNWKGKKPRIPQKKKNLALMLLENGYMTYKEIEATLHISKTTLLREKKKRITEAD